MKRNISIIFISLWIAAGCSSSKKTTVAPGPDPSPGDTLVTEKEPEKKLTIADFLNEYIQLKYPSLNPDKYIYVSVKHQRLFLIKDNRVVKRYPVSTAEKGTGNRKNSYKTPIGMHKIEKKIGEGVPPGGLFRSRIYTGEQAKIYKEKKRSETDDITSRIMWLSGLEKNVNKGKRIDSFKRHIYIHGTSEEGYIGTPASHGCIRMKNNDVIELFNLVEEGLPVLILTY